MDILRLQLAWGVFTGTTVCSRPVPPVARTPRPTLSPTSPTPRARCTAQPVVVCVDLVTNSQALVNPQQCLEAQPATGSTSGRLANRRASGGGQERAMTNANLPNVSRRR
ncbi:hypothetical protein RRG08_042536 [Elysia crispata]|uniref:Uncharacterized protein n=1 Tax=Elysia crispata TaxID=231223 RepID=A0AAE0XQL9_9GAST|nr:hypothetical protein RRG08_042536 [Elysia crispata]